MRTFNETTVGSERPESSFLDRCLAAIKRHREINRSVRELSALNNEILKDIGIERGNIREVVEKMAEARIEKHPGHDKPSTGTVPEREYPVPEGAAG